MSKQRGVAFSKVEPTIETIDGFLEEFSRRAVSRGARRQSHGTTKTRVQVDWYVGPAIVLEPVGDSGLTTVPRQYLQLVGFGRVCDQFQKCLVVQVLTTGGSRQGEVIGPKVYAVIASGPSAIGLLPAGRQGSLLPEGSRRLRGKNDPPPTRELLN